MSRRSGILKRLRNCLPTAKYLGANDWKNYAAAAGAALATSTGASADIVHINLNLTDTQNGVVPITSQGHLWIKKSSTFHSPVSTIRTEHGKATLKFGATGSFAFLGAAGSVQRFNAGANIAGPTHQGSGLLFGRYFQWTGQNLRNVYRGQFYPRPFTSSFVGFEMNGEYGWIRLKLGTQSAPGQRYNNPPGRVTITDMAYNTVAGQAIFAGQTTPSVPEPGTLALGILAAGAAGVTALRRRYKANAEQRAAVKTAVPVN